MSNVRRRDTAAPPTRTVAPFGEATRRPPAPAALPPEVVEDATDFRTAVDAVPIEPPETAAEAQPGPGNARGKQQQWVHRSSKLPAQRSGRPASAQRSRAPHSSAAAAIPTSQFVRPAPAERGDARLLTTMGAAAPPPPELPSLARAALLQGLLERHAQSTNSAPTSLVTSRAECLAILRERFPCDWDVGGALEAALDTAVALPGCELARRAAGDGAPLVADFANSPEAAALLQRLHEHPEERENPSKAAAKLAAKVLGREPFAESMAFELASRIARRAPDACAFVPAAGSSAEPLPQPYTQEVGDRKRRRGLGNAACGPQKNQPRADARPPGRSEAAL